MALHLDSAGPPGIYADDHALATDPQMQVQTAVVKRDGQLAECFWPVRVEDDAAAPGLHSGEATLHEVDTAGHRRQVNAFRRCATLDVGDVGDQSLLEELH